MRLTPMRIAPEDPERDWTEPGVYEVAPDIYRVPLPLKADGLRAVNVYALRGAAGLTLVDSGQALPETAELLPAALDALGYGPAQVDRFLITHIHLDHYTHAVRVRREHGVPIALGEHEKPSMDAILNPAERPFHPQVLKLVRAGAGPLLERMRAMERDRPPRESLLWEAPDEWLPERAPLAAGDRTLTPLHTPGHTAGHLVYWDGPGAVMFTGDHILPHITPSIGFEAIASGLPLGDYLDSLHKVRALPDARMLPAHGRVTPTVHSRVDALLEHHDGRLTAMAAAVRAGAGTAYEVARAVPWTRREKRLAELDVFNQVLAVNETGAHLDLLLDQGRLTARDEDGVTHYA